MPPLEDFCYCWEKSLFISVSDFFFSKKQKTVLTLTQPTQLEQCVAIIPTNRLGTITSEIHSPLILPFYFLALLWERKSILVSMPLYCYIVWHQGKANQGKAKARAPPGPPLSGEEQLLIESSDYTGALQYAVVVALSPLPLSSASAYAPCSTHSIGSNN